ncbi:MAG: SCO family protein [Chloroflexota bacterium]|nr:SCO family protein [Chloroflexota bacterium]
MRRFLFLLLPLLVLMVLIAVRQDRVTPSHAAAPVAVLRGTEVFPRGMHPAPAFALRDQTGVVVSPRTLRGQVVTITFLDSSCVQECPVAGRALAATQRLLGSRSPLHLVVISVNPGHDTPQSARTFIREAGIPTPWLWLFGTHQRLAPVWAEYGIQVQPGRGDIVHTPAVYLLDRRGSIRVADAVPFSAGELAGSVRALAEQK